MVMPGEKRCRAQPVGKSSVHIAAENGPSVFGGFAGSHRELAIIQMNDGDSLRFWERSGGNRRGQHRK